MNYRSSVIIPVFNTGAVLRETVESVLSQSDGKDEIIIVDDASTDKVTLEILESLKAIDNVKLIRNDRNRGHRFTRNTGVAHALSEIIVFLDSDDMLAPGYFEKMLSPFSDPEVAFTYCDIQCFGEINDLWKSEPFTKERIIEYQYICGCSPFRKSVFEAVGGLCEEEIFLLNEDWDFWLSVCERGFKGVYIPGGYYLYRRHKSNITNLPRTNSPAIQRRMLERHWDFITKYMTSEQFMAHGYKEAAYAYLQMNKPVDAIRYVWKLLMTSGRRKDAILLILTALKKTLK